MAIEQSRIDDHSYVIGVQLDGMSPPWYSLLVAMVRTADSENLRRLALAFPNEVEDIVDRYNNVGNGGRRGF